MRYRAGALPPRKPSSGNEFSEEGRHELPESTVEYLRHGASEGERNNSLAEAARQCRDSGRLGGVWEERLVRRAMADGLSEKEARDTVRSCSNPQDRREPCGPVYKPGSATNGSTPDKRPARKYSLRMGDRPAPATAPATVPPAEVREATPDTVELYPPDLQGYAGFRRWVDELFKDGEFIAISPYVEEMEGPHGGVTLEKSDLLSRIDRKQSDITGLWSTRAGVYVRMNPMTKDGKSDKDVTSLRYMLVEFDVRSDKREQLRILRESMLPIASVTDSGDLDTGNGQPGKGLHALVRLDAENREQWNARRDAVFKIFEGTGVDTKVSNPSRYTRCPSGRRGEGIQRLVALNIGAASWDEWETGYAEDDLPELIDLSRSIDDEIVFPDVIVDGIIHRGSKMVLGGGSKSFKTWTLIDLGLSVSQGVEWLGRKTHRGDVLYVNLEIPDAFFRSRVKAIMEAKGLTSIKGFHVWNLRGWVQDATHLLPKLMKRIRKAGNRYSMIIIDPIYKILGDRDENKAGDVTDLLNEIERIAVQCNTCTVFGAHFSKGSQAGKESMDRISGSGAFGRDPDAILTMTAHEEEGCFTVSADLRNMPPLKPFVVRREHPLMVLTDLDPKSLKSAETKKAAAKKRAGGSYSVGRPRNTDAEARFRRAIAAHYARFKKQPSVRECLAMKIPGLTTNKSTISALVTEEMARLKGPQEAPEGPQNNPREADPQQGAEPLRGPQNTPQDTSEDTQEFDPEIDPF